MSENKKVVLTYEGLKKLEEELEELKKQEVRETFPRMRNTMLQKKSRAKLSPE